MNIDWWRFICVLLICVTVAAVTHQYAVVFISGSIIVFAWQYHIVKELLLWLRKRKEHPPPSQPGIIDDICREIDYLRSRHKQRKSKLAGYLKRFQNTTAAIPDAAIVLNRHGEITWANAKAYDYMGIHWPNDGGLRMVNLVRHPQLRQYLGNRDAAKIREGLQLESPINSNMKLECRITSFGKTQKLLIVRDITVIHQINQMRRDFVANASHELRTPLTVISGYLEDFAHDPKQCPREWLPRIEQMRKQALRMSSLIEDLLLLATLENKSVETGEEAVAIPTLLENIRQEALSLDADTTHFIHLDADPSLRLKGDPRSLHSAFANLLVNAVQHTPDQSVIHVRWYQNEQGAHLEVTDNGLGIAAEQLPRLTERFYRVDKGRSGDKGGTGLGLAIVKHVMAIHGGSLHIESELTRGTTFRCDFPRSGVVITAARDDQTSAGR